MSSTVHEQHVVPALAGRVFAAIPPQRRIGKFGPRWTALLVACDVAMFGVAASIAIVLVKGGHYAPAPDDSIVVSTLLYATFWLVLFERLGLYRRTYAMRTRDEVYAVAAALSLGAIPQFLLFTIVPAVSSSRSILLLSVAIATVTVGGARAALHAIRAACSTHRPLRVAVVGTPERVRAALASLNFPPSTRVLALHEPDVEATLAHAFTLDDEQRLNQVAWLRQARAWGCDRILLTEVLPPDVLPPVLELAAREKIVLAFAPPRLCAHAYDYTLQTDGHQALIVPFRLRACTPLAHVQKRTVDIAVASIALALAFPVMLLAACAIIVESGRPVFFRQQRVGRNGRTFDVLKFRTMRVDAERGSGPVWATRRDPRKTRLGVFLRRTSIDELPQLVNVLRGDMSLVGPRPERPEFVREFRRQLPRYDERHLVRPGITGWSQIHMKRVLDLADVAEKLSHDLFYVENWSPFMDLSIIVKTGCEFLFHRAG